MTSPDIKNEKTDMLNTYIQLLTIILAFAGVFLALKIYILKKRIDYTTLRARAFLNESFLMDTWTLILLICFFFIIHASAELNNMLGLYSIDERILEAVKEGTELGILISIIILVYKWFSLVKLAKK